MSKMFVKQKMVLLKDTPKCRSLAVVNGSVVAPSVPDGGSEHLSQSESTTPAILHTDVQNVCKTENGCAQ